MGSDITTEARANQSPKSGSLRRWVMRAVLTIGLMLGGSVAMGSIASAADAPHDSTPATSSRSSRGLVGGLLGSSTDVGRTLEGVASVDPTGSVTGTVQRTTQFVTDTVDPVAAPLQPVTQRVTRVVTPVTDTVTAATQPAVDTVLATARPVVGSVGGVVEPIVDTVNQVIDPVTGVVTQVVDPVTGVVTQVVDPVTGVVTQVVDPITAAIIDSVVGASANNPATVSSSNGSSATSGSSADQGNLRLVDVFTGSDAGMTATIPSGSACHIVARPLTYTTSLRASLATSPDRSSNGDPIGPWGNPPRPPAATTAPSPATGEGSSSTQWNPGGVIMTSSSPGRLGTETSLLVIESQLVGMPSPEPDVAPD